MNNPTADGDSYDYYPERYTGTSDYGGVHLNSGIANLAYYLLCQGGTHPRGKTTTVVTAIGMTKAEQIFYRAPDHPLTTSTNFQGAR
jgi:vibriolysin